MRGWLETCPVHVANVTLVVAVHRLTEAEEGRVFRLMRESWAARKLLSRPDGTSDAAWEAFLAIWQDLDAYRVRHEEAYERRSSINRNNAQKRYTTDAPANRRKVASESQANRTANRMRIADTHVPCESPANRTEHEHEHEHHQEHEHELHQEQEPPESRKSESSSDPVSRGARSARRPVPRRRRPPDLTLTPERLAMARDRGLTDLEAAREWAGMGDHEYARPKTDWDAAWRRWCDTVRDRRARNFGPPRTPPRFAAEASQAVAERLRAGILAEPVGQVIEFPLDEGGAA